ncbi:MAG: decaprenyl-phosphate phosphoribosyltransferase [Pseudomonadota bacterium]
MKNVALGLILATRPYQWIKNLFIFLPLVFSKQLFVPQAVIGTSAMFILFCLAASAVYLINDIADLEDDQVHEIKKHRPLAAGRISKRQTVVLALILLGIALFFSFMLELETGLIILSYLILNLLYSKYLKHIVIIDVFCVGAFYYLRILAGSVTSGIALSEWIIFCTVLLALFLAFNKRRYDLKYAKVLKGRIYRKYTPYFIDHMVSIISASVALTYALYVMDPKVVIKFGTHHLFYTIPFVYYGLFRYIYLVEQKGQGGDPTLILLKDRKLQLNLLLWTLACIGIIYFKI